MPASLPTRLGGWGSARIAAANAAHIAVQAGIGEKQRDCTEVHLSMSLREMTDQAVDKTAIGLTDLISRIESRRLQHARQILEMQHDASGLRETSRARGSHQPPSGRACDDLHAPTARITAHAGVIEPHRSLPTGGPEVP